MLTHYSLLAIDKILRAIFIAIPLHIMRTGRRTTENKKLMAFIYNFIFNDNYITSKIILFDYTRLNQ